MKNSFSSFELRVDEWLKKANDDELNACSILKHRDGDPSGVCFLCNQMSEKYFKAFLVFKNNWFPKIHSLIRLTEFCQKIDRRFEEIKDDAIFLMLFMFRQGIL